MYNVCIVLVTYNPNLEELEKNISSYIKQVKKVIVIDNSTTIDIQNKINKFEKIHLISLGDNLGIAKAQNIGIKYAIEQNFDYIIEMDQDSSLPINYVKNILKTYNSLTKSEKRIAGIGPKAVNKKDRSSYNDSFNGVKEVDITLSSGFLITKQSFLEIGSKDEDLFIDLVDWEWCWRAKSKGYKVFIDYTLEIDHMLGDGHKKIGFIKIGLPSPIRHYYQYRNSLYLMQKNYIPFLWKVKRFLIHLLKPIIYIIFFDKKVERIKYLNRGIIDFLKNKKGKLE